MLYCKNLKNAFSSYHWYLNGNPIPGAAQQIYKINSGATGDYYVITTDMNSCELESNHLRIENSLKSGTICNVYPNPASTVLLYEVMPENESNMEIALYNAAGQKVWEKSYSGNSNLITGEIPVDKLAKGIYMFKVIGAGSLIIEEKVLIGR